MVKQKGKIIMAKNFTRADFEKEVLNSAGVALVDFWASWCGPCKMVAPIIDEVSEEYAGRVTVGKVNVDEEGSLASEYAVVSIPTIIVFKDGKQVEKLVGVRSFDDFCDVLDKYL